MPTAGRSESCDMPRREQARRHVEPGSSQAMVPVSEALLRERGGLAAGAKVLDFGCGLGRHVREFRRAGFDAVGVDRFVDSLAAARLALPDGGKHLYFSSPQGDFPFESKSFDYCYSTSVFEHVLDYEKPISEIARVLKPGAWTLHVFPARWRPIEPHMFTPFGGRFQQPLLIKLWARLGIRNSFQNGLTARETADRNIAYSATGINYPTTSQVYDYFSRHFSQVQFAETDFIAATVGASRMSRLLAPLSSFSVVERSYRGFHTRVVLARNL